LGLEKWTHVKLCLHLQFQPRLLRRRYPKIIKNKLRKTTVSL